MPRILDSNAYLGLENELNNLFDQIYKHNKKDRAEITSQVQQFLDNLSDSFVDHARLLFTNLRREEIINFKVKKPGEGREKFKNVDALADYFNNVAKLIFTSIAQQEDPTKRAFYFDTYVQLMNACYSKGDFTSSYAMFNGLIMQNLLQYIDIKKVSPQSRLIFKELDSEFDRMQKPFSTVKVQNDLREKGVFIPLVPALLGLQAFCNQTYNNTVERIEEIQSELRQLDLQNNRLLNQMQRESFTWSGPYYEYMRDVFLPQSILEYTRLITEYDELIASSEGSVAKRFQDDQTSEGLSNFLDLCLTENRAILKPSPFQNERVVDMLTEIGAIPAHQFDDEMYAFLEENCTSVKAKQIGQYSSKIFARLEFSYREEHWVEVPEQPDPMEPQNIDHYELSHNGLKLMVELQGIIDSHRPTKRLSHAKNPLGFFNGIEGERLNEDDLQDQTVLVY